MVYVPDLLLAGPMYKQNSEIHFDLNLIPLKKQVNVIWLSKVISNNLLLEKRTGISEVYIKYIVEHQEEILKRWSSSHARRTKQETAEERNANDALHHILMEWAKRMHWNGNRIIGPSDIEYKANQLRRRLLVTTYRITSNFWEEFIAFKLQEIGNFAGHVTFSLNTEEILKDCKKHIDCDTYKKFIDRLVKRYGKKPNVHMKDAAADSTQNAAEAVTEDDAESDTDNDMKNATANSTEHVAEADTKDNAQSATDNDDVILIEEPIECIDVDMDNANDDECDGNLKILIESSQTELNSISKEIQHVSKADKHPLDEVMTSLDKLETGQTFNDDERVGTVQTKSEPQQQSNIEVYADNLPTQETINSTIDDRATNNDPALNDSAVERRANVNGTTLAPLIKSEPKQISEEHKSKDEYPAQYNGETYIDIIEEDDDMLLIEVPKDIPVEIQNEREIEIRSEAKSTSQTKRKHICGAKKPLIDKHKPESTTSSSSKENFKYHYKLKSKVANSGAFAGEETYGEEYTYEISFADNYNLKLKMPSHSTVKINDSQAKAKVSEYSPKNEEEQHDHTLLDNLIYEWSKRYMMNRMIPALKPGRIIEKANKLKVKLNLHNYSVNKKLLSDIFDFKARKKFRKKIKLKWSMNMVKILRECEFDTPSNTYFKFMNILKNRTTADSKLRTYIGWRRVEIDHKQTGNGRSMEKTDNSSSLKRTVKRLTYSYEPVMMSMAYDTKLKTYGSKGKAKTKNKTDNISTKADSEREHNLRGCRDSSSTSVDYDILQRDLPSLRTVKVAQKKKSSEPIDLPEKRFQRLSQICYEFNKNVETEKESLEENLPLIDDDYDDELFLPNIEGDFGTVSDARTRVTYKITEVVNHEDNLDDTSVECREEPNKPDESTRDDDDDALLFSTADFEMMAKRIDDNIYEPVSNIKQEIPEVYDNMPGHQLMDNEEEFISCNDTIKDVKQEPTEKSIVDPREGETDYYNEEHDHTLATSNLINLCDTDNEDDDEEIFKALAKGNFESLMENEEEFISCNDTIKDVKQEPTEKGIEDTDYYNEEHDHRPATSNLKNLYDTENEDDNEEIFKALAKGNFESLMENEEEFISFNDTMKDVKQEPTEKGIEDPKECDTDYYNEEHDHTLATSNLKNFYDTENEDDDEEIFKALAKGNFESLDITEKEDNDNEEEFNDASLLRGQDNESQDNPEDNEFVEVLQIIGDKEDDDDDGEVAESEEASQSGYTETEDNNKEVVMEDSDAECAPDNADSFIQELNNMKRLNPKPITTPSKRQIQMNTFGRKCKRICLETEDKSKENLRQSDKITEIAIKMEDDSENDTIHSQDDEEPITILEIVSDEEDDNNILPDRKHESQQVITSKTSTVRTSDNRNSFNQSQSSSCLDDDRNSKLKRRSDENARRSESQALSSPVPMEQPTLTNASDAIDYLIKLKDFFKKRNDLIGLQLVLNLETTFIYHDIGIY